MDLKDLKLCAEKLYESTIDRTKSYPNSADKLFIGNKDYWHLNACISQFNGESAYISGYLDAAKLLSRIVIFSGRHVDTLVYPIIFLYRHYLELTLKELIREGLNITNTPIDSKLEKILEEHNLMTLWNCFVPFFTKISGHNNDFKKVKKGMESYINQIHQIDPISIAFRYQRSRNGQKCNLEEIKHINIGLFCQNMEKLTGLLEDISCEFGVALDYTNDVRTEYHDF